MSRRYKIAFFTARDTGLADVIRCFSSQAHVWLGVPSTAQELMPPNRAADALMANAAFDRFSICYGAGAPRATTANVTPDWRYRVSSTVESMTSFFRDVALRYHWAVFPWGDPGGNLCFCAVYNDEAAETYYANRSGGPVTFASSYESEEDFRDHHVAALFDEDGPGTFLWHPNAPADESPLIVCWRNVSEGWPTKGSTVIKEIKGDVMGGGRLAIYKARSREDFVQMCNYSLARNAWLFSVPGSTPTGYLRELAHEVFAGTFLFGVQSLSVVEWYFSAGQSNGDRSHCFYATRRPELLQQLETRPGISLLSCF